MEALLKCPARRATAPASSSSCPCPLCIANNRPPVPMPCTGVMSRKGGGNVAGIYHLVSLKSGEHRSKPGYAGRWHIYKPFLVSGALEILVSTIDLRDPA